MIRWELATLFSIIYYLQSSHCCQPNKCDALDAITDDCPETRLNIPVIKTYCNKTYYFDVNYKLNWHNAYLACKKYNMELVSIDSDAEFDYVREFINGLTTAGKVHVWTSGNDLGTEGLFKWMSNGQRVFSNRWHNGQPDNTGSKEHCMHFWYSANVYLFNDFTCGSIMPFICQSIKKSCCRDHRT